MQDEKHEWETERIKKKLNNKIGLKYNVNLSNFTLHI